MRNKSSYLLSADVIRDLAILGVLIIHNVNSIYARPDFFGKGFWWIALVLNSISRISIPLFIMLSGYLILNKDESFTKSVKRLIFRIIIPLIIWDIFYTWWADGISSFKNIDLKIILNIFNVNTFHLYFLVIMAGLYFAAPFIRNLFKKISYLAQKKITILLFLVSIIGVFLQYYFNLVWIDNFFTKWIPFSGFFIAGFLIGNKKININKYKLICVYLLGLVATIGLNYLYYYFAKNNFVFLFPKGAISYYFDYYLSPNVVIMSIAVFILLFNFEYSKLTNNIYLKKIIGSLAKMSFGIYVFHLFISRFLEIKYALAIDFTNLPMIIYFPLKFILIFLISYMVTLVISKIPIIKIILGFK